MTGHPRPNRIADLNPINAVGALLTPLLPHSRSCGLAASSAHRSVSADTARVRHWREFGSTSRVYELPYHLGGVPAPNGIDLGANTANSAPEEPAAPWPVAGPPPQLPAS